jgi:hypothetical protein
MRDDSHPSDLIRSLDAHFLAPVREVGAADFGSVS